MFTDEDQVLQVVVNDEEQYSIWPVDRDVPPGWTAAGFQGVKGDCLAYIDQVWTDMRPRSVREGAAEGARHDG
ncbi:MbtH family NRPS accessory protein [Micromonospora sonneratiae]|uniref:MbtH family protein n=1 Tax=Micromonospora sonneratiae TaxID=1184706 RepID=A0ABW3YQG3_9ACTN